MAIVSLRNVDVSLPVFGPSARSLKSAFGSVIRGGSGKKNESPSVEVVHALRNISISLSEGDRIGLRGPNGAGKSTFLRLVGGVYQPTNGELVVSGTRRCLFGLASGMEMEGTGWENIRIGARRIGVSNSELDRVCDDVAEFSELGKALDRPIRTYSQGMLLRLSFGVMTSQPAEIILIDEVIGVGDSKFMERANDRMMKFADQAKILLLASHSDGVIRKFCNQILTFEQGQIAKKILWERSSGDEVEVVEGSLAESQTGGVVQVHESFEKAIQESKTGGGMDECPKVRELTDALVLEPLSIELHRRLAELYSEKGNHVGEWLQRKNVEALAYLMPDRQVNEDDVLAPLVEKEHFPPDFSVTRAPMESLATFLDGREEEGVILSVSSPWYSFPFGLLHRKLLTFHELVNGLGGETSIAIPKGIQCVAVLGPSRDDEWENYRIWIRKSMEAGVPFFAAWLRWTGCEDVISAEYELIEAAGQSRETYFSVDAATQLAEEEGCELTVIPHGRYLQSRSEWLAFGQYGWMDPEERLRYTEAFFKTAFDQPDALDWPSGYLVVFSSKRN